MKRYFAVIDTNVIVSSLLSRESIPGRIVDLALLGKIVPLLNAEIVAEYSEVLGRNKFNFKKEEAEALVSNLQKKAVFLERVFSGECFPDPDDAVFFEIALSGRSTMDAYLVTGNAKHFPVRSFVVTPRQMMEIIESDLKEPFSIETQLH